MKAVYLAGPMRGYPGYNFQAFFDAACDLRSRGYTVFNPAEHDSEAHPELDFANNCQLPDGFLAEAMAWDLHHVMDADEVVVLPGWARSNGVFIELTVAFALGKPVYEYPTLRLAVLPLSVMRPADAHADALNTQRVAWFLNRRSW